MPYHLISLQIHAAKPIYLNSSCSEAALTTSHPESNPSRNLHKSKVDLVLRDITPHISMPIVLAAKPLIEMYRKQTLTFGVPTTVAERLLANT